MKSRNRDYWPRGPLALSVSNPVQALDVSHKDEVLKLAQEAIAQAEQGESGGRIANAKEAPRLAYTSLKDRHSFIMQPANDRLQRAIQEDEKGRLSPPSSCSRKWSRMSRRKAGTR